MVRFFRWDDCVVGGGGYTRPRKVVKKSYCRLYSRAILLEVLYI